MFERKITFYCYDSEIEKALPRLLANKIDFSVHPCDSQKKECWAVTVAYLVKDSVARMIYSNG